MRLEYTMRFKSDLTGTCYQEYLMKQRAQRNTIFEWRRNISAINTCTKREKKKIINISETNERLFSLQLFKW